MKSRYHSRGSQLRPGKMVRQLRKKWQFCRVCTSGISWWGVPSQWKKLWHCPQVSKGIAHLPRHLSLCYVKLSYLFNRLFPIHSTKMILISSHLFYHHPLSRLQFLPGQSVRCACPLGLRCQCWSWILGWFWGRLLQVWWLKRRTKRCPSL